MKTIFKLRAFPIYLSILVLITVLGSCETNDAADRISVTPQERPTISSIVPTIGRFGDEITITGTNFDPQIADNSVTLNGREATILSATSTSILITVPDGASTGQIDVSVINFNVSGPTFTVLAPLPLITDITPLTGGVDETVTITGENFGANIADNTVSFNGTAATITASSVTSITTSVPNGATTGSISITTPGGIVMSNSDFTVLTISTLSIPLTSNDDDVEEVAVDFGEAVGTMDLGSSDLELGEISSSQGLMNIGLRFNNVAIPQGATVSDAIIQFKCDNTGVDPVELTIYGENVGNAAAYTGTSGEVSARALTTANAVWSIPEWVTEGDRGDAQKTVNLSSVIQEIVNRSDWVSGNSINIIMKHTGASTTASNSSGGREAENYSSSTADDGAELTVTFSN